MQSARGLARRLGRRLEALPTSQKLNASHVVSIILVCIILTGLVVWALVTALRRRALRRRMTSPDLEKGEKALVSAGTCVINLPGTPPFVYVPNATRMKPAFSAILSTTKSVHRPGSTIQRLRMGLSVIYPSSTYQRMSSATVTEHEIIDFHLSQGTMPIAFAPVPFDVSSRGSMMSFAASDADSCLSVADAEVKSASVSSLALPKLNTGPVAHRVSQRTFGSSSTLDQLSILPPYSGIRTDRPGRGSILSFGLFRKPFRHPATLPTPTSENQRTVRLITFSPLLPDELVLRKDETVTVLETFDDGWCIVARTTMGMLEVGAVPEWVFGLKDGEDETFGTMRPMRSSSLGVTVGMTLAEPELLSKEKKARIISWSNF